MTREELHQNIRAAFADMPYPKSDEYALGGLRGKSWQSLTRRDLNSVVIGAMLSKEFHYYFPAFLLAVEDIENSELSDNIFNEITPPEEFIYLVDEGRKQFEQRFREFTLQQKRVIRQFVDFSYQRLTDLFDELPEDGCTQHEVQWIRLREYWRQF